MPDIPADPDGDVPAIAWQHAVRLRALVGSLPPPREPSRRERVAWLVAIALHLLIVVVLRMALRAEAPRTPASDVIRVELMPVPFAEPSLPQPAALPATRTVVVPGMQPRATTAIPKAASESAIAPIERAEPEVRVFNADGSAAVPSDLAARIDRARPRPDFIPKRYEPSPLMQDKRPLKVRPNHFAQYWNGTDGKPLHETMWRYVTAEREFTAPWGGRYGCAWIVIIVACADVPDKPWNPPQTWKPATELDER